MFPDGGRTHPIMRPQRGGRWKRHGLEGLHDIESVSRTCSSHELTRLSRPESVKLEPCHPVERAMKSSQIVMTVMTVNLDFLNFRK